MSTGAPGGPATSRTTTRPRAPRCTVRASGSSGDQALGGSEITEGSRLDAHDFYGDLGSGGRDERDHRADRGTEERFAERRTRRHDGEALAPLLDGAVEVLLDLVLGIALVADAHHDA